MSTSGSTAAAVDAAGRSAVVLGYLQGVDFFWTAKLWPVVDGQRLAMAVYFRWDDSDAILRDTNVILRHERLTTQAADSRTVDDGLWFGGVAASVALLYPSKTFPGTERHPWRLCELVQLAMVAGSLLTGSPKIREANTFNYAAIVEVVRCSRTFSSACSPRCRFSGSPRRLAGLDTPTEFFWLPAALARARHNADVPSVFPDLAVARSDRRRARRGRWPSRRRRRSAWGRRSARLLSATANFMARAIAESLGSRCRASSATWPTALLVPSPILALTQTLMVRSDGGAASR